MSSGRLRAFRMLRVVMKKENFSRLLLAFGATLSIITFVMKIIKKG